MGDIMTMRELAELANVSISTVSKAFSDADDVREDTKNRIFEIAKQYGCFGKFYKGKFSKKIIAIICSELISNYYISFVERLQNYIEDNGGIAIISVDHFKAGKQAELIDYYASYLKVDGIIVFNLKTAIKKGYDIPIVSLFGSSSGHFDSVNLDFNAAMTEAFDLLHKFGHRKVAYIGENLTKMRGKLFDSISRNYPDMEAYFYENNNRFEKAGQTGVKQMLEDNKGCTAIFCAYDNIAIGAIKQLKKLGFSVPEDFSVIGADNINTSEFMPSALTTIDSNPDEICAIAWELLEKKQKNKFYSLNKKITIKCRLIIRESVTKVKEN